MKKRIAFFSTMTVVMVLLATMIGTMAFAAQERGTARMDQKSCFLAIAEEANTALKGQQNGTATNPGCPWASGVQADYSACPIEGCTLLGMHEHDGVWYRCSLYGTTCPSDGTSGYCGGLGAGAGAGNGAGNRAGEGAGAGAGNRAGTGAGNGAGGGSASGYGSCARL